MFGFVSAEDPEERFDQFSIQPDISSRLMEKLLHYRTLMVPAIQHKPHPKADPALHDNVWTPGWC